MGTQLSEAELLDWQRRAGAGKAYDQAVRYLGIRRRSRAEIERYLRRKDWDDEVVAQTLRRLDELGLVDDQAFAAAWIRDRQLLRPRSTQALRFELMKLGVGREAIDEALAGEVADQSEVVYELAKRRRRQYANDDKLMAYLARQGFAYADIKKALARLVDEL